MRLVDGLDPLQMAHEAREVFNIPPEAIELFRGSVHGDGLLDLDRAARSDFPPAEGIGADAQGFIHIAVAGEAAKHECSTEQRQGQGRPASAAQTIRSEGASDHRGQPSLGIVDVDVSPILRDILSMRLVLCVRFFPGWHVILLRAGELSGSSHPTRSGASNLPPICGTQIYGASESREVIRNVWQYRESAESVGAASALAGWDQAPEDSVAGASGRAASGQEAAGRVDAGPPDV